MEKKVEKFYLLQNANNNYFQFIFLVYSFLLTFLSCASDPIQVRDGVFETPLTEVSGVTSEEYNRAKEKKKVNLFDIYAIAMESNEKIAIRYEKIRQAEAKKRTAFGMFLPSLTYRNQKSQFFPDPKITAQEQREKEYLFYASGLPSSYQPIFTGNSGSGSGSLPPAIRSGQRLVLRVPIFNGLADYSAFQSSKTEVELRKWEMSTEARQLLIDLSHNYFSLLLLEKAIEQRKENLKITKELEREYRRRVGLGLARSSELASFTSRILLIEAEIYSLEENRKAGIERIIFLSGLRKEQEIQDDISIALPEYNREDAVGSLEKRPDIKAAKTSIELSKQKELGAKGEFLPNVYVDGIYNIPQGNTKESYFFQFIFEVPIFSGGKTISAIQEFESMRREAELNFSFLIRSTTEEVNNLYQQFETSHKEEEAYRKALEATEKSHKLIILDYNRKIATSLDVLTSLGNLSITKENYERAKIQLKLNRILLGIAVGEFPKNANHWKEKKDGSG